MFTDILQIPVVEEYIETAMSVYTAAFDNILKITNNIVTGCEISKELYDGVMGIIERSHYQP